MTLTGTTGSGPGRWKPLRQRPPVVLYSALVQLVAVVLTVLASGSHIDAHQIRLAAALVGLGIVQNELSRQVERARRQISGASPHINMTSVWTFAAVLLLPAILVIAVVFALYLHLTLRSWYRLRAVSWRRPVTSVSLAVITCLVSSAVLHAAGVERLQATGTAGPAAVAAIVAALAAYFVVAAIIALPALKPESHRPVDLFGTMAENILEISTLCLGAVTALVLLHLPELSVFLLPPLLLLQRSMLVSQLEVAVATDVKTGVLNTSGWYALAERRMLRLHSTPAAKCGILMIDLDHFKTINDRFGHLAGDEVLKAVATAIAAEVRDSDGVGRFGGEEFVVHLPDAALPDVWAIAERIRESIAGLAVEHVVNGQTVRIDGVSASIGISMYPAAGLALEDLVQAADAALYTAKREGRNRIVTAQAA
jgi:diguanylate cyclase (GGDEF)-like protein